MIANVRQVNSQSVNESQPVVSSVSQEEIRDLFQVNNLQEQIVMEEVIRDMALYFDEKYAQRIEVMQARIDELEANTQTQYRETGEILAGIINEVKFQN